MSLICEPSPSDGADEEWALVARYLTLLQEHAGQRKRPLPRRWMVERSLT